MRIILNLIFMPSKQRINEKFIRQLDTSKIKGYEVYTDDDITGFGLRVTEKGAIAFVLTYSIAGRKRRYTIGKYPDLKPVSAREEATRLRSQILKGIDPMSSKLETQKEANLETAVEIYKKIAYNHLHEKTIFEYELLLKNHIIPKLGKIKLSKVNHSTIQDFHLQYKNKKTTGNRALTLLSAIFNILIANDLIKANPAFKVKKFKEHSRNRSADELEIKKIMKYLDGKAASSPQYVAIVKLLIYTGSRSKEVLNAEWCQFDLDKQIWHKPYTATKQNKDSIIPLGKLSIDILKALDRKKSDKYLFVNPKTGKPYTTIRRFWATILQDLGISNLRVHDLRHSFVSLLANEGIPYEIIGAMVGHSNLKTTQRYSHINNTAMKSAIDSLERILG